MEKTLLPASNWLITYLFYGILKDHEEQKMKQWNILLTDGLEDNGQTILRAAAQVDDREGISPSELTQIIKDYDALIVRGRTKVTAELLANATRLKVVGRAGVGVDNIDLPAAQAHQVVVVNAPNATTVAVAELALGLMFALARMLPRADAGMKAGQWLKKELQGSELNGKTLGLIGLGNIGRALAQRASALGMAILAYDPYLSTEKISSLGALPVSLSNLYAQADYISIHVPLTSETRGFINAQAFKEMKPGVRLICTARGGLIDEEALLVALNNGQVTGAALDVFAKEPPGLTPLISHPQVICTPHIGAQTTEAQGRAAADIAAEVLTALRGEPLRWRVA